MQLSVTFKNLETSDALRSYLQKKLDRVDKLLDSPAEANAVFSVEKIRHIAEINVTSDGMVINAKENTESMYSSIDMVIDKVKKQINKNKEKLLAKRGAKAGIKAANNEIINEMEESDVITDYEAYENADVDSDSAQI
jgi:putative sigma-54 modulation protein